MKKEDIDNLFLIRDDWPVSELNKIVDFEIIKGYYRQELNEERIDKEVTARNRKELETLNIDGVERKIYGILFERNNYGRDYRNFRQDDLKMYMEKFLELYDKDSIKDEIK